MGRVCSLYGGRGEVYTGFRWKNPRERGNLEDVVVDGRIIIGRWMASWTGLVWLRIGAGGGLL
jgi:hypothetical protein